MSSNKKVLGKLSLLMAIVMIFGQVGITGVFAAQNPNVGKVVISEIYGGGGNSGAVLTNDYIQLYNPTNQDVDLSGMSVVYFSSAGISSAGSTSLGSNIIKAHDYFLIKEAAGTGGTSDFEADVTGTIAMSGTAGKVALISGTSLTVASGALNLDNYPSVIDFVGYGSAAATYLGTGPTPNLTNTTRATRVAYDNNNATDFVSEAATTVPKKSGSYVPPVDTVSVSGLEDQVYDLTQGQATAAVNVTATVAPSTAELTFTVNGSPYTGYEFVNGMFSYSANLAAGTYILSLTAVNGTASETKTCVVTVNPYIPAGNPYIGKIVISEVYGGGGNSGATLKNDYIQLFNTSDSEISLAGWSLVYYSAAGLTSGNLHTLSESAKIKPHDYFLLREASGSGGTVDIEYDEAGNINLSGTAGKLALVSSGGALTLVNGSIELSYYPTLVDFVGFGTTASTYLQAAAPAPSNTNAINRVGYAFNNSSDYIVVNANVQPKKSGDGTAPADTVSITDIVPADGTAYELLQGQTVKDSVAVSAKVSETAAALTFKVNGAEKTDFTFSGGVFGYTLTNLTPGTYTLYLKAVKGSASDEKTWSFTVNAYVPPTEPKGIYISQIHAGGGNTKSKFIELYNDTDTAQSLNGWSIQYAAATSVGNFSAYNISGTIPAHGYFLVRCSDVTSGADVSLPSWNEAYPGISPDYSINLNFSASRGKLALVKTTASIGSSAPASGTHSFPASLLANPNLADILGYGQPYDGDNSATNHAWKGATPAPVPRGSSIIRVAVLPDNGDEYVFSYPFPRNSSFNPVTDTTPPTVTISVPEKDPLNNGDTITIEARSLHGIDAASAVIKVDGTTVSPAEVSVTEIISGLSFVYALPITLAPGAHALTFSVKNNRGIEGSGSANFNFGERPVITIISPENGTVFIKEDGVIPVVSAKITTVSDPVNTALTALTINSVPVAFTYDSETGIVSYTAEQQYNTGVYTISLSVTNQSGITSTRDWKFTMDSNAPKNYKQYRGQLHSHTSLSDGAGNIDTAYDYARDVAGLDFFAVTDHSNSYDNSTASLRITDWTQSTSTKWKLAKSTAEDFNNTVAEGGPNDGNTFITVPGFEMTWSGGPGHINTFATDWFGSRSDASLTLPKYYERLKEDPESISQLNHPGTTFGTFDDFDYYDTTIDQYVTMIEVGNGEGAIHSSAYFPSFNYYTRALDKGWHLAPTINQDNHQGKWGTANDGRDVVLVENLTRDEVLDALRQMRMYATEDKNMTVNYTVNGKPMGSTLSNNTQALNFFVSVSDPDSKDKIEKIEIITNGGKVAWSVNVNASSWEGSFSLPLEMGYYYVLVTQADNDLAATAPVWYGETSQAGINNLTVNDSLVFTGNNAEITAKLYNISSSTVTNAKITFYLNGIAPENALYTETIAELAPTAGTNAPTVVYNYLASQKGDYVIYAEMEASVSGKTYKTIQSVAFTVRDRDSLQTFLIDNSHYNYYVSGEYANNHGTFKQILKDRMIIPEETLKNVNNLTLELTAGTGYITDEVLSGVTTLVLAPPAVQARSGAGHNGNAVPFTYTDAEVAAIARFVAAGGNLILTSRADFNDNKSGSGIHNAANQNKILEAIGANLRVMDDEVIQNTVLGTPGNLTVPATGMYRITFYNYNESTKFGLNPVDPSKNFSFYSGSSVGIKEGGSDENVDWLICGANTSPEGWVYDPVNWKNGTPGNEATTSLDSDLDGSPSAAYIDSAKGTNLKAMGAEVLPNGSKIVVAGTTFFSDFEVKGGDNVTGAQMLLEKIVDWMAAPNTVTAIADVREQAQNPENMGKKVVIEGVVVSESQQYSIANGRQNGFFDCIYVSDGTATINVFNIGDGQYKLGQKVRITGAIHEYLGDIEVIADKDWVVPVTKLTDSALPVPEAKQVTTAESMTSDNGGTFMEVTGVVTSINSNGWFFVNDGSGESRIFLDGYITDSTGNNPGIWNEGVTVGATVSAKGFGSTNPEGARLRVRNTDEIVVVPVADPELIAVDAVNGSVTATLDVVPDTIPEQSEFIVTYNINGGTETVLPYGSYEFNEATATFAFVPFSPSTVVQVITVSVTYSGVTLRSSFTIDAYADITGISINKTGIVNLKRGAVLQPVLTITFANGVSCPVTVVWTSSNPNIAYIDSEGVITAKSAGTVVISVKVSSAFGTVKTASFTLKVTN